MFQENGQHRKNKMPSWEQKKCRTFCNCLISYVSGPVASHNSKVVLYITRIAVDGIHYCRAQVAIFDIPPIKSQLKI